MEQLRPRRAAVRQANRIQHLQRERDVGDVDLREAEPSSDDRVAHLGHRPSTLDGDREADPEQDVLAGVVVDPGPEVDPIHAVPQDDLLAPRAALEGRLDPDPAAHR